MIKCVIHICGAHIMHVIKRFCTNNNADKTVKRPHFYFITNRDIARGKEIVGDYGETRK